MLRLKRRQDFLAAAKAVSVATPGFVLQGRNRRDEAEPRVGFTCSKKLGNAVARNRAKRRLREVVRLQLGLVARAGYDYVFVGRLTTADRAFADLQNDLKAAVTRLHGSEPQGVAGAGKI